MAVSQHIWLSRKTLTRKTLSKVAITTLVFPSLIHCSLHQNIRLQSPQHTPWTDNLIVYKSSMQHMRGQISHLLGKWMPPSRYSAGKTITIEMVSEFEAWLVMSLDLNVLCLVGGDQRRGMICTVPCDQGTQVSLDPRRVWVSETYFWLVLDARSAAGLWISASKAVVVEDASLSRHRRDKGSN